MKSAGTGIKLRTLVIFRRLLEDDVICKLMHVLDADPDDMQEYTDSYCAFAASLFEKNTDLTEYVRTLVMNDENFYVHSVCAGKQNEVLEETLAEELKILQEVSQITPEELLSECDYDGWLPRWTVSPADLSAEYRDHLEKLPSQGYGIYAKYHAFSVRQGALEPVRYPDPQKLSDLIGYRREREQVIRNTLAFLQGLPANNVLLYGDAGTGKSSTIKAISNEYAKDGLRLIEVKKYQMHELPSVIEKLAGNPLKFIIFIDDLSFEPDDDSFVALKNILEGGISDTRTNVLVYATSNRRHFVKERMSAREGNELYANDSIQETMSLAARFGLTVTYQKPMKNLYLEIVDELAERAGIALEAEELHKRAEAFALRASGRSPRTAKQFIEALRIEQAMK